MIAEPISYVSLIREDMLNDVLRAEVVVADLEALPGLW